MRSTLGTITLLCCLAWTIQPNHACHTSSLPDTDELTEGPYWIDPALNRSNITEGQQGTPFTLTLRVWNKTTIAAACAATADNESNQPILDGVGVMTGVQVDIWYASAAGHYSGFAAEGTAGQTWLRGYQMTDTNGYVTFKSIFPGWYTSRTTHIHTRIRVFNGATQVYDDTTQLFFDDTLSDSIYAANSLYSHGSGRDTHNSNDNIYQSVMLINNMTGNTNDGYVAFKDLYYPFVTTGGSNGGNGGTTGGPTGGSRPTPPPGGGMSGGATTAAPTTATPTTTSPTTATPTTIAPATATPTTIPPNPTLTSNTTSSSSSTGVGNAACSSSMSMFSFLSSLIVGMLSLF